MLFQSLRCGTRALLHKSIKKDIKNPKVSAPSAVAITLSENKSLSPPEKVYGNPKKKKNAV